MNQENLHRQIWKYFEAELTQKEEKVLLRHLLRQEGRDPTADEALAVMLASRMTPTAPLPRRSRPSWATGIAASVAVLIGVSAGIFIDRTVDRPEMIAYVGGVRIENSDEIKKIIETQLYDIEESSGFFSRTVASDIDDIREALTFDDI